VTPAARRPGLARALGEEARHSRRAIPAGTFGVVAVTGLFYLLVIVAEMFGAGRAGIPDLLRQRNPLGYLTSHYWSPSVLWTIQLVVVLTGLGFVVAALNVTIRVLFVMGREQPCPGPSPGCPAAAPRSSRSGVSPCSRLCSGSR
jgi:amino acid transporter